MEFTKSKKVFIVDADEKFTRSLRKQLEDKSGHEVYVFNNCDDCLKEISIKPQVIILDSHLNTEQLDHESHKQLLEVIRKDDPSIHVIMLGKNEGYGTAMQSILNGAEQFVIKDETTVTTLGDLIGELP
jgi:DNA-binding NtrC family response regulator